MMGLWEAPGTDDCRRVEAGTGLKPPCEPCEQSRCGQHVQGEAHGGESAGRWMRSHTLHPHDPPEPQRPHVTEG